MKAQIKFKAVLVLLSLIFAIPLLYADEDTSDERLAAQYFHNGQYERAVVLYEELFEEQPTEVIYNNYLTCLLELEEYRQAERVVRSQIDNNPGQIRYEVDLGYVMQRSGSTRRANRHFNGLIDELPTSPRGVISLAEAFLNRDMTDLALQTYKKGRDKFGRRHPFNIEIARIYEEKGDYENMMSEYVDLVATDPGEMEKVRGFLQDAISDDPEYKKNDALRGVLLRRSQRSPANTLFSEMLLWLSIQQKDFEMAFRQARALDRRLQKDGEIVYDIAALSMANNNFDIAEEAFSHIVNMGSAGPYYMAARVGLLDVKFKRLLASYDYDEKRLKRVEKAYESALEEFGIHRNTVSLIRNLANIKAFYLDKPDEAVELLESIISMVRISDRIKAECRIEMADILVLNDDVWDAKLLYARVEKSYRNDPVGHEAKYKNARLSFYMCEFDWAKAQLDILKAATSKLISNDAMALSLKIQDNIGYDGDTKPLEMYAKAERMAFMNRFDEAFSILDSIAYKFPEHQINDDVLFAKARLNLKTGSYHVADSLLAIIAEKYPQGILADEALFKRAEINENILKRPDKAREIYRKIMVEYPASIYSHTARNRFRTLRDDLVN